MGFSLPAKFSQMSWAYFTSPWLTQCFLSGNISVGMKQAKPKRKKPCYLFFVIWKIFKNSIGWKRNSRISNYSVLFLLCRILYILDISHCQPACTGAPGQVLCQNWMDTVLGSSSCPCWMSRAPSILSSLRVHYSTVPVSEVHGTSSSLTLFLQHH